MKTIMISLALALSLPLMLTSCKHGVGGHYVAGNERGSQPTNQKEVAEYKRAVLRCYKTGGTRVVKITGKLRCYN